MNPENAIAICVVTGLIFVFWLLFKAIWGRKPKSKCELETWLAKLTIEFSNHKTEVGDAVVGLQKRVSELEEGK